MMQKNLLLSVLLTTMIQPTECRYVYLFSHGIAGTHRQAYHFTDWYMNHEGEKIYNKYFILYHPLITFDYHDSWRWTEKGEEFAAIKQWFRSLIRGNYSRASLAQESDIEQLSDVFSKQLIPDDKVIILGVSRGASNILTFLCKKQPNNVAAAILESPFASIENVLDNIIQKSWILKGFLERYKYTIFKMIFTKYSEKGIRPIECIDHISKDIPLLFVCVLSDGLVPHDSSIALYTALKRAGHKKVHLLVLLEGNHGFLIQGKSANIYQETVHAFYKKYGLPHDPELATKGEKFLH
jgi:dienelactone hydrolase